MIMPSEQEEEPHTPWRVRSTPAPCASTVLGGVDQGQGRVVLVGGGGGGIHDMTYMCAVRCTSVSVLAVIKSVMFESLMHTRFSVYILYTLVVLRTLITVEKYV